MTHRCNSGETSLNRIETAECLRPGGIALTKEGLALCNFLPAAHLADIGCGSGGTVVLLEEMGYIAVGLDLQAETPLLQGDAADLPFESASLDGLLYECSFSKMSPPEQVLEEAFRVLKPAGKLLLSDFYARGEAFDFQGLLGRVEREETIKQRLLQAGFRLLHWKDASYDVLRVFGQLIFEHGCIEKILGANRTSLKKAKSGYFLSIWEKMS